MANNITQTTQTKWADHLRGCASMTNEIAEILDIRDDAARQAMFATIAIDAKNHGVFLEPVPKDTKTPVIPPEPAAVEPVATKKGADEAAAVKDEQAAARADEQIKDVPRIVTPDEAEGGRRTAFLKGIESARDLLNKEGHVPPITPKALNAVIAHDFAPKTQLGSLDVDELEKLMMLLNSKLEVLREKKSKTVANEEIDF